MAPKLPRPAQIVRNATIINGGSGVKDIPRVPAIENIGMKEFVAADRQDRDFARFFFL